MKTRQRYNEHKNRRMGVWRWLWRSILIVLVLSSPVYAFDTSRAVIHHTASPDWSADRIRRIHIEENGWRDIGYHVVIRANGQRESGRPIPCRGAHSGDHRNEWIGIALTGYDEFTTDQVFSLIEYCKKMGIRHIERHHEKCPGDGIKIENIQWILNNYWRQKDHDQNRILQSPETT